jgi:hypothetical protein
VEKIMSNVTRPRRFARLPKIGQRVRINLRKSHPSYPNGTVARVVEILAGCCGPILALDIDGYGTVDLFWKKVLPC